MNCCRCMWRFKISNPVWTKKIMLVNVKRYLKWKTTLNVWFHIQALATPGLTVHSRCRLLCGHHPPSLFSDQEKSDIGSAGSIKIEKQTLQSHLVRLFGLSNVDESVVFQKPLEQMLPGVRPRSRRRLPCVKKTVPLYSSHIHVNSPDTPHSASAVGWVSALEKATSLRPEPGVRVSAPQPVGCTATPALGRTSPCPGHVTSGLRGSASVDRGV